MLDLFDRHRIAFADLQHACSLTRRRTESTGELRKVVRRVQLHDRVLETVVIDEVVPVRNQIPEGTAVVTERHAAVHATATLLTQLLHRSGEQKLAVVIRALTWVPLGYSAALDLQEAAELAHQAATPSVCSSTSSRRTRL